MKIQLKRSAVATDGVAKQPDIGQMEFGELAVNYNSGDPAIFLKDNAQNIIRIAGAGNINAGDNPSGPQLPDSGQDVGDVFFNTTNNKLYFWDGTAWVPIATDVTAADIFVGTLDEINLEVPVETRRNGFLWWNVEDGSLYIWYIDADTSQFVIAIPASGSGGASVAVLDTPPTGPNDGDLWWNTVDGRLYIWYQETVDNGQWVDSSPDSQTSPITSGETFPADALENDCFFNTTDGRLYIYYNDGSETQWVDASPDSQGAVYWNRNEDTLVPTSDTNDVSIGGGNIELKANGSAEFSKNVVSSGGNFQGYEFIADQTAGTFGCFTGKLNGAETSKILGDGSASFMTGTTDNPGVFIGKNNSNGSYPSLYLQQDNPNGNFLTCKNGFTGALTTTIAADGSATFAGDVSSSQGIDATGWRMFPSGSFYIRNDFGPGAAAVIKIYRNGKSDSDAVVEISNDGSAEFARNISVGEVDKASNVGAKIYDQGAILASRAVSGTAPSDRVFYGRGAGADTSAIFSDGSAQFSGSVEAGVNEATAITPLNGYNNVSNQNVPTLFLRNQSSAGRLIEGRNQLTSVFYVNANGNSTFAGSVTSNGNVLTRDVLLNLEADDDTKYTATTDVDGNETRVYNGATLDVKDSLQKILAALVAIKTASETAGTLDDLKSAIATATTNITEGGN